MAKFCTYCGKPMPEDGVCDCVESAAAAATQSQQAPAPEQPQAAPAAENVYVKKTKTALSQFIPFVKTYFKDPAGSTLKVLQEKNLALAIVMMVFNALVTGLFLFATFGKLAGSARSAVKELGNMFSFSGKVDIAVPVVSTLFFGILMAAVILALSILALFALLKILKVNASWFYVTVAVGVNTVLCTACTALALVSVLVGLNGLAAAFLVFGVFLWGTLGVLLCVKVFGAQVTGLMTTLSALFFAIILVASGWCNTQLAVKAVGNVTVEDEKIADAIEMMQDQVEDALDGMDAEEIVESIVRELMYAF